MFAATEYIFPLPCRAWLEAEILVVKPKLIVCLGATAAQSLLGPQFRITRHRLAAGEKILIARFSGAARFLHLDTGRCRLTVSTPGRTRGHNAAGALNAFGPRLPIRNLAGHLTGEIRPAAALLGT